MALWGKVDEAAKAPKFDINSKGESGVSQHANTCFGMTVAEAKLVSPATAGWVRVVNGTGGRSGRKTIENLVVIRRMENAANT